MRVGLHVSCVSAHIIYIYIYIYIYVYIYICVYIYIYYEGIYICILWRYACVYTYMYYPCKCSHSKCANIDPWQRCRCSHQQGKHTFRHKHTHTYTVPRKMPSWRGRGCRAQFRHATPCGYPAQMMSVMCLISNGTNTCESNDTYLKTYAWPRVDKYVYNNRALVIVPSYSACMCLCFLETNLFSEMIRTKRC